MQGNPPPTISLVIPIYNEEAVLPLLLSRLDILIADLKNHAVITEVVFVNDGSRDNSMNILCEAASERHWARIIGLSRNFGHQIAVTAGLENALGEAVVIMDADLQDPPELLPEMLRLWREGYQVVYAVRRERAGETAFKKFTAALFYRLLRMLVTVDIPADTGDFRLMDRRVVDALNRMGERHRFLRGMASWVGFRQIGVPYDRDPRAAGTTKYPLRKMFRFAGDAITSFSNAPLTLATKLGWTIALCSMLYGLITVVRSFLGDKSFQPGWASTIVAISLLSGVQLITLGLIGEYIGRIYDEVKGRPLYFIATKIGWNDAADTGKD